MTLKVNTSQPQAARIVGITTESAKVQTLTLDLHLQAEPGQFVMAWLPGLDEKPFSLVGDDPVILTVARVGPFSTAIHGLGVGDRLWLRGPLGHAFSLPVFPSRQSPILLIGGGYGVAPLHFLARRALTANQGISMVIGARTAADVIYAGRFAILGAQVAVATEDGSRGQQGLATDIATRLLDQADFQAIYACGPEPMLEAVERLAGRRDLPVQLSYERYMRCGFGVCGSCTRAGWLVCRDGPVRHVGRGP